MRIKKVLKLMRINHLDNLIVTDYKSIYYLTYILIKPNERFLGLLLKKNGEVYLINNELFPIDSNDIEIIWYNDKENPIEKLKPLLNENETLGIDKFMYSHFLLDMMRLKIAKFYVNGSIYVDSVRMIKSEDEIKKMRVASKINDDAMDILVKSLRIGITELECEEELKKIYKNLGGDDFSFTPIIAFGANGANPHHENTHTKLEVSQSIILDIGCMKNGYASDMTRTIFSGSKPHEHFQKVYDIVKKANEMAIEGVCENITFSQVDKKARDYITESGYGKYFTHRTGHSCGLEDHEYGDVSSVNEDIIQVGQCFSIEPGIYLPEEEIGVRIEDLVIITEDGCEVLNKYTKEIIVVPDEQ